MRAAGLRFAGFRLLARTAIAVDSFLRVERFFVVKETTVPSFVVKPTFAMGNLRAQNAPRGNTTLPLTRPTRPHRQPPTRLRGGGRADEVVEHRSPVARAVEVLGERDLVDRGPHA